MRNWKHLSTSETAAYGFFLKYVFKYLGDAQNRPGE